MQRKPQIGLIWTVMAVFGLVSLVAVVGNSLLGYGWHTNYSISKYVGLETWSVLVFALGNFVVAGLIGKYLFQLGQAWQMPKAYYIVVVILATALIGLSLWPCGYFDQGSKSVVTVMHEINSRTMFGGMMVVVLMLMGRRGLWKGARAFAMVFAVYGLMCCLGYFLKMSWFMGAMLFLEAGYIWGFMGLSLMAKRKEQNGNIEAQKE